MTGKSTLIIVALVLLAIFFGILAGAAYTFTRDLPQIRSLEEYHPSSVTRIHSSDRILLAELFAERRDPVPIDIIPEALKTALVTTEDRSFYSHIGVDLKGITRAVIRDIIAGEFVEGASTITQQLAKTLFLTPQKTITRKLKEAVLAFQLERRYTKDEILTLYLNQIYFGSGAYGVESAAQIFFGKSVTDLTIEECALIAAMPKAPSRYSPLVNPQLAKKRRNIVLKQMKTVGLITESQYRQLANKPLTLAKRRQKELKAPYFIEYIKPVLEEVIGSSKLYQGGLKIQTTLNYSLQQAAEAAVVDGLGQLEARMTQRGLTDAAPQGALVALNVHTGAILAMVGGKDFYESPFNRAVDALRQPGSAFKPILYAYAIEKGFAQNKLILDAPVVYKGGAQGKDWRPENFSKTYQGEMTLRKALSLSKNIPAVRLMESLSPTAVIAFAKQFGIHSRLLPNLSLALGTSETTLIELTAAYGVFPNGGKRMDAYGIRTIVDHQGMTIWHAKTQPAIAMSAIGAAIMVDMLQGVVQEGTGKRAKSIGRPVAGKTGTANSYKDALFVGFSPSIATGVWVGTDPHTTLGRGETGAKAALPIWTAFMAKAMETRVYEHFGIPDGVVRVPINPDTGSRATPDHPAAVPALFVKGTAPLNP